jgi:hypothetical protein
MKQILVLVLITLSCVSCKKISFRVAGTYNGTSRFIGYNPSTTTFYSDSAKESKTVMAIDADNISIDGIELSYKGFNNNQYTYEASSSIYNQCSAKFDASCKNLEYYTQGPGNIAYNDFKGSR